MNCDVCGKLWVGGHRCCSKERQKIAHDHFQATGITYETPTHWLRMPIPKGKDGTMRNEAPWTEEEVVSLNDYQACGIIHPFTGDNADGEQVDLRATKDGWIADLNGPVVQTWAHAFMADGSWREHYVRLTAAFGGSNE